MNNREIKFRAWASGRMWPDAAIIRRNGEFIVGVWNNEETDIVEPYSDVVVMQFTGLTDKNGREIYEGDILSGGEKIRWKVEWSKQRARWEKVTQATYEGMDFSNYLQVIGNIYEHAHLLQG